MPIRDFCPDDYRGIVDIQNALFPDHLAVVEDHVEGDEHVASDLLHTGLRVGLTKTTDQ